MRLYAKKIHTHLFKNLFPLGALAMLMLATWIAYSLALPGYFLFDDEFTLKGLYKIQDIDSAIIFIFSGTTGPIGRPLTLATFALQADAWPENSGAFLRINFLIHLFAVLICFLLAFGLARLRALENYFLKKELWIGVGVSALWALSPFLSTTHLMIVQRMTSLSGLLTFIGLASFVWAHIFLKKNKSITYLLLIIMAASIAFASLAKENGALLPILALIVLLFWIPDQYRLTDVIGKKLIFALVLLPSVLLLIYLVFLLKSTIDHGYGAHRYFTVEQRILSQPTILLDYVRNLFIPQSFSVTPFMDRIPAPKNWLNPPITIIAFGIWAVTLFLAFWKKKHAPYFLFGLLFFLAGHLLESTFLGLELYFAHRNYVPAFGLYFALVYGLASLPKRFEKITLILFSLYLILFFTVLIQVTSGWKNINVASRFWLEKNPYSERVVQVFANQKIAQGDFSGARKAFDDAVKLNPNIAILQIQRTQFCIGMENEFSLLLKEVVEKLKTADYHQVAAIELFKSAFGNPSARCSQRDYAAIHEMTKALLQNPIYAQSKFTYSYLLATEGLIASKSGDIDRAIKLLVQAFRIYSAQDFATQAAILMANNDQHEKAYAFIEEAKKNAPSSVFKRIKWINHFDEVYEHIQNSQKIKSKVTDLF